MRRFLVVLVTVLAVAGCGDDDASPAPDATSTPTSPAPSAVTGTLAPEAVTSFSCRADSSGHWIAGGELTNTTPTAQHYRVTVFLGSGEGTGHSTGVGPVAPGAAAEFSLGVLPPADPQATCRIRVEVLER